MPNRKHKAIRSRPTDTWTVGFEIEVLVGDMGMSRWEIELERYGPHDIAPPAFCRDVAKQLSELTGRPFKAPRNGWRPGTFAVLPEYDLDPISFDSDICGGVEIVTPPLPFSEAEELLRQLDLACESIGASVDETCGCHINVSHTDHSVLDVQNYIFSVNEEKHLVRYQRYDSAYARPQLDVVTPAILAHLREDRSGLVLTKSLHNAIYDMAGYGKTYAANFDKLDRGYLELRFWNGESIADSAWDLSDLAADLLTEMSEPSLDKAHQGAEELVHRHVLIRQWLDSLDGRLRLGEPKSSDVLYGHEIPIVLDDRNVALFTTYSGNEINSVGGGWARSLDACRVPHARLSDWREGFARLVIKDIVMRRATGELNGLPDWASQLTEVA